MTPDALTEKDRQRYQRGLEELRDELRRRLRDLEASVGRAKERQGDPGRKEAREDVDRRLLERERWIAGEVDSALERLRSDVFGTCLACSRPIARERLDALPYTSRCASCAQDVREMHTVPRPPEGGPPLPGDAPSTRPDDTDPNATKGGER